MLPSLEVWNHLPPNERSTVAEEVARILTEELENEWIQQDLTDSLESPSELVREAIRSEASSSTSRERFESESSQRPAA